MRAERAVRVRALVAAAGLWACGSVAAGQVAAGPDGALPWPEGVVSNANDAFIVSPRPARAASINGPRVYGARPGRALRLRVPVSGERPVRFEADLPAGLSIDGATGEVRGTLPAAGDYPLRVRAWNAAGRDEAEIVVRIGETIGLTPAMGWNSWNCWGTRVSQARVEASARAIVASGLSDHGWTFVNIDDTWQAPTRGGAFNALQGNERFPDMAGLARAVQGMGLKLGIYSTPWVTSYAGHAGGSSDDPSGAWEESLRGQEHWRFGEFGFEDADARQWAAWGIDYLKYDWNPNDPEHTWAMRRALDATGRDIVYSLSNSAPLEHAEALSAAANLARTTGDIRDRWRKDASWPYEEWAWGLVEIWDRHEAWRRHCRPGFFPDADMMVLGEVSWSGEPRPTGLTPDEQFTHVSLWCLWSSPLLIGFPVERVDRFTLSLLTNDEVLAVNQDALGVMARTVLSEGETRVIAKPMSDGSVAVGLFNRGEQAATVRAPWSALGLTGRALVRDLWRRADLAQAEGAVEATVPAHGVVLLRLRPADEGVEWTTGMLTSEPDALFAADTPLRNGDRVVFFGDSITQEGSYIRLIGERLAAERPGLSVALINKGVGGNRVPDLQGRFEQDVLALRPTAVVVYVGVNDVWHAQKNPPSGTPAEVYEAGLRAMVGDLTARGVAVVLTTPSVIGESPRGENPLDAELDRYAGIAAAVAADLGATLCDLRGPFFAHLAANNPEGVDRGVTTTDTVHMLPAGSAIVADAVSDALARSLRAR